ncbi:MAG: peptide-binding protein [Candidatus Omnitrophica bacterium]|nr:peptide-binding protein [Candidatus Omnitrophota bacterium]
MSFRKKSLFQIAAFLFISMFSASYCEGEEWVSRDAYVYSGASDARILIPFFADDATSSSICSLIYNGLIKVDKNLNIIGDLAEGWKIADDGINITFYLRKDVFWHDGEPFTSKDVKFTFEKILDPQTVCPYISNYSDIKSIEIIDAYTIKFSYSKAYAPAILKFGMGIVPCHLFEQLKDIRGSKYARSPIGTGAYVFSEWKSGQYILLNANPDYYEHIPGIKRYVYKIVPDQSVQFLELVTGEVSSMNLNPYQFLYRSDTKRFKENINKYKYLAHAYTYIGYNQQDPFFKDKKVRQALSLAINKREIIDAVLLGLGEPCTGPFLPGTPYYDFTVSGYEYNPEKAKTLLNEAGWKDSDKDGVLEKNGVKFCVRIATNQGTQVREDVAVIVQSQWAKIGVKTEVQVVAWSAFLDQFVSKKNFQAVILGWTIPLDPDLFAVWHSQSIGENGLNFVSYVNKKVDELIELGRGELNPLKRQKIYRQIHKYLNEDAPYTFLFNPYALEAVQKRFKGIDPAPAGIGYNFIDWCVPENEVRYKFD